MEQLPNKDKSYHDILSDVSNILQSVNSLLDYSLIDNNPEMEEDVSIAHESMTSVYLKIHHIVYNNSNSISYENKRLQR